MSDITPMAQELSVGMLDHSPVPVCPTMYISCKPPWRFLWSPWQRAGADILAAMDAVLGGARRPWLALSGLLVSTLAAWFVYVPVHELLHALGCVATGGEVTELQISPLYGGRVLESLIPAVVARGPYAGRLSGFETHGSDLVCLATDAALKWGAWTVGPTAK